MRTRGIESFRTGFGAHVVFHKLNYRKIGNREMEIIKDLT